MSTGTFASSIAIAHVRSETYRSRSTFGVGVRLRRIRSPLTTSWSYTVAGVVSDWYESRTTVVSHSGFGPRPTSCGSDPNSSSSWRPSRKWTHTLGWASLHSCTMRWPANGSADVNRRPATWGSSTSQSPGASIGATITWKSGASRLVSTTNRSPQWSIEYSTSGTRARTMDGEPSGSSARRSHASELVLLLIEMTIHCSLRVLDTSR